MKRQVWGRQSLGRKETIKKKVLRRIKKSAKNINYEHTVSMMQISHNRMLDVFLEMGTALLYKRNKMNQKYYPQGRMCYITEPIFTIFKSRQSLR